MPHDLPSAGAWRDDDAALWARIVAHPFEDAAAPLDFTRRLARDHGWRLAEAREAVEEYRRFAFLAARSATPLTPSPQVDEVWHLHLTYTEDYWQRWCGTVLRRPLHHGPTRGHAADAQRFRAAYAQTLADYRRHFGPPDARCWPAPAQRFADPARYRWVDREASIVLPRPSLRGLLSAIRQRQLRAPVAALLLAALLALPAGSGLAAEWNPLDWRGPAFLRLYLVLLAMVVLIVVPFARRTARATGSDARETTLGADELALLAGGAERAFDAAVAELLDRRRVRVESGRLLPSGEGSEAPELRGLALLLLRRLGAGRPLPEIRRALDDEFQRLRATLVRRGLLLDDRGRAALGRAGALPLAALLLFGVAKIVVGLLRDKPVGLLALLCLLTAILGLVATLWIGPGRTRAGDWLVADAQRQHRASRRGAGALALPRAVALFGLAPLAAAGFVEYQRLREPAGGSDSGSTGSSSDDSSSGSSDSGGGGSGCGGCGGGD